jgi:hypothetical protein
MPEKVQPYYLSRFAETQRSLVKIQRDIYYTGTARLLVAACTAGFAYFFRTQGALLTGCILFVGMLVFLILLQKSSRLQKKKVYFETSLLCDKNELSALEYDFSAFDGASERIQPVHPFSFDLDIFGKHSLFQSMNRTCTVDGKQILADWFENPLHSPDIIQNRQKAIQELKGKPDFIHHFQVTGLINQGKESDRKELEEFIAQPPVIRTGTFWMSLRLIFPILWIIVILFASIGKIAPALVGFIYVITLILSESQVKKINKLQARIGKKITILTAFSQLMEAVENEKVESEILAELQSHYRKGGKTASAAIGQLAQLAEELDQRANLVVHLFLNPLFLRDIHKTMQIDQWREEYGKQLEVWIKTLGEYDAFCSLSTFAFTHPDCIFPEPVADYFTMKGKNIGHPLMNRTTCVKNDIEFTEHPYFLIITGANMAGKSTYLRTIGVNFVLACMGAPVCADSLRFTPSSLMTSLRTSDSLNDNESYFFAELKRLKRIIDRLESGEKLFIILDEILKGTNSVDKQKGSIALVQQFIRLQSCGIIATHDLLLGSLEQTFPQHIKNYRFEADITNDTLTFSYRLKEGIAQNMNATFLMKKMGITL